MHAHLEHRLVELLEACMPAAGTSHCPIEGIRFLRDVEMANLPARGPAVVIGRLRTGDAAATPLQCLVLPSALTVIAPSCATAVLGCSQFSREFKRFFGRSPAREALALRAMLAPGRLPDWPIILR